MIKSLRDRIKQLVKSSKQGYGCALKAKGLER